MAERADSPSGPGTFLESYGGPGSGFLRFQVRGMGTENVLLLGGAAEDRLRAAAHEALGAFGRLEEKLSKFLPASDVSLLNALGSSRPVRIGADLLALLGLSRQAWELTGGTFDPTVGPLVAAWGFGGGEGRVPPAAEIEALLVARGMDHVHVDEAAGTAWFDRPGVSLDLGAIGKGYAVDAVARLARKHGVPLGAVTSGRSSVLTWGIPPGEDGWRFEVVHPDEPGDALARLEVEPGAMSSSSASERRFFQGGSEYGHVIDPRTGRPARASRSATAWTRTAVLGDVLTTAVYVAGKEALSPGGAAEKLAAAWCEPGEEPRASVLLVEEDPGTWGGLRTESWFVGRQGWKAERIP